MSAEGIKAGAQVPISFCFKLLGVMLWSGANMDIDHRAPLKARKEIVINAPIETVWALLTDIEPSSSRGGMLFMPSSKTG